ncbi:MAG: ABC transporter ATP-binding protein [Aggregatilineales bacterium]
MSDIAIHVEGLAKRYRVGASREKYRTLRDTLPQIASWPYRTAKSIVRHRPEAEQSDRTFWALEDVAFDVEYGEALAIIGRNGAGKSTLLKILARITDPTKGSIEINGRIGSLLEVGTGFHPELTGRENIFLNGAILGMKNTEVRRKLDEIIDFAEVAKFIDTPLKHYSTGMMMRLAFAVAAHLETEILLVDEVLAVGDANFQKKSLGKMKDIAHEGRTVLFVSHNMGAVNSLCRSGIVIERGHAIFQGTAGQASDLYLQTVLPEMQKQSLAERVDRKGNKAMTLVGFSVQDVNGNTIEQLPNGATIRLVFDFEADPKLLPHKARFGFVVRSLEGVVLSQLHSRFLEQTFSVDKPRFRIIATIQRFPLVPGRYYLDTYLEVGAGNIPADYMIQAAALDVADGDFYRSGYQVYSRESAFLLDGAFELEVE